MTHELLHQWTKKNAPETITDLRTVLRHAEKIMHFDCKHIPSRFLLSELVSQSARLYTAVSCWKRVKTMKHLDNYCSPGFWTTIMWLWHGEVCAIWLVILVWGSHLDKQLQKKTWLRCTQCLGICNQHRTPWSLVIFWQNPSEIVPSFLVFFRQEYDCRRQFG